MWVSVLRNSVKKRTVNQPPKNTPPHTKMTPRHKYLCVYAITVYSYRQKLPYRITDMAVYFIVLLCYSLT